MRVNRHLVALTTATALLTGGCGSSPELTPNRPALEQSFEGTLDFWQGLGVTGLGGLQLQTIVGGVMVCGSSRLTRDSPGIAAYCGPKKTIVISDETYGETEAYFNVRGIDTSALEGVTVTHEVAHAVIENTHQAAPEREESLADCLAGVAIAATAPNLRDAARVVFDVIGDQTEGGEHGMPQQRFASFNNGFENGLGACDPGLPILLDLAQSAS
jgi:hypothetical protein